MRATTRLRRVFRSLIVLLPLAAILAAGVPSRAQQTERAKKLGARLMCMCNCNQILTACNHVGCSTSAAMLKKLDQLVARNEPDDLTLQSFIQEYGERVLAEPPRRGFTGVAWFIPGMAFALGLGIVLLVILRWRRRMIAAPAGQNLPPELLARARQQAEHETED